MEEGVANVEDDSEGVWAPTPLEEESSHPMRSSRESTPSPSTTEEDALAYPFGRMLVRPGHMPVFIPPRPPKDGRSYKSQRSSRSSSESSIATESEFERSTDSTQKPEESAEDSKQGDETEDSKQEPTETERSRFEEELKEDDKVFNQWMRIARTCAVLTVFSIWIGLAALKDFQRALPWLVLDCLIIVWYAGSNAARALELARRARDFAERHNLSRFDAHRARATCILDYLFRLLIVPLVGWIVWDASGSPIRLRSIGAVLGYVVLAVVCSAHPARIKWKPVLGAFTLQLAVGIVLLRWATGREKLVMVANQVVRFLDYTANGTAVVYEFIAFPPAICGMGFVFLFTAMQIIIYFGGIVSLLYYYGIIQAVLAKFALVMQYTLGTTVIESLNAVACIFLGQTESAVLIGPAFETMTSSEITTVMCSGFACIAGALFSAYISFGACPEYLLSATVMSAAVSLGIAKILYPEIQVSSQKNVEDMQLAKHEYHSFFEAISKGAIAAAYVVGAIGISLVVYLSILRMINHSVRWTTERLGYDTVDFNTLVGLTFYPLAYMMGASDAADAQVNRDETFRVAELMGIKTTVNEFVAYAKLAEMIQAGTLKGSRAQMMATYALCGFSNIASIGAVLGIMSTMCPRRMRVFSRLAIRGLLGGCISCFLTASVAGILVEKPTTCQPKVFNSCLNVTVLKSHLDRRYGLI